MQQSDEIKKDDKIAIFEGKKIRKGTVPLKGGVD